MQTIYHQLLLRCSLRSLINCYSVKLRRLSGGPRGPRCCGPWLPCTNQTNHFLMYSCILSFTRRGNFPLMGLFFTSRCECDKPLQATLPFGDIRSGSVPLDIWLIGEPMSCCSPLGRLLDWSERHTSTWTLPLVMSASHGAGHILKPLTMAYHTSHAWWLKSRGPLMCEQ